jgi:hypothetical protein
MNERYRLCVKSKLGAFNGYFNRWVFVDSWGATYEGDSKKEGFIFGSLALAEDALRKFEDIEKTRFNSLDYTVVYMANAGTLRI